MRLLAVIFVLFACSTPPEHVLYPGQESQSHGRYQNFERNARVLGPQAEIFDRFLKGELEEEKVEALTESCQKEPQENVFCFSILNGKHFEDRLLVRKHHHPKRIKRVRPKIRKGKIKNWLALRFAPVDATLDPLSQYSLDALNQLKTLALKEEKCPNNISISLASNLEDYLPDQASPYEIAQLYEKGASCLTKKPVDRRALLTRAGLFYFQQEKHKEALSAFTQATALNNTFLGRALYWKYRSELKLNLSKEADQTLKQLKDRYPFAFHTLVAQTAENTDPGAILSQDPHQNLRRSFQVPAINLLIEQVEILHRFGFEESASVVLEWAAIDSDEVEPEVLIYLAELEKAAPDKIAILAPVLYENPNLISKDTMELYFPKAFFPIFEKHSAGIDPYLLLSIARQESAFNPNAVSNANAVGLLQVLPSTGRLISKVTKKKLMEPIINIRIGAQYFQKLLAQLNGHVHLALAAYNAGVNRIPVWIKRYETSEPILFIDLIPYRETREYVALVLRNYYWYRRLNSHPEKATAKKVIH